eukprot:CAMPEP_0116822884 /NCGR_PEP_ID=MMETSP0418-20121206/523_1 /TAXON_ID=1158023 /ORGANISM="Astrosyne radiata, Strain 13vi08-1A" /LENGTH=339 /DNA_ID=CAMNT_0004451061 /DNA_START=31 /DNA_END=1050 /DNA_ORIENTATION=+
MSESFSHAYVSSVVRAGEALGTLTSTMIPYDIFSDETGAWEDPCRVPEGFTPNLSGEELVRRAHARAMIQKSLKKMQDRNNIQGGTPTPGPYADPAQEAAQASSTGNGERVGQTGPRTPGSAKKRASFTFAREPMPNAGTGSGVATSVSQYNPNHHSTPLFWDNDSVENTPYGRHLQGTRPAALCREQMRQTDSKLGRGKRGRVTRNTSIGVPTTSKKTPVNGLTPSTTGVEWEEVANIFHDVKLPGSSTASAKRPRAPVSTVISGSRTIIAPFCRKLSGSPQPPSDTEEPNSGSDEDLDDTAILSRHQVVLDRMKKKLDKFMDNRQSGHRGRKKASNK